MAVATHHQQVGIELATFFDQRLGNLVLPATARYLTALIP
jgi:hypothetical protein